MKLSEAHDLLVRLYVEWRRRKGLPEKRHFDIEEDAVAIELFSDEMLEFMEKK